MITVRKAAQFLLVGVLALALANSALAKNKKPQAAAQPRTSPSFSDVDKDMDGKITLEEFKKAFPNLADAEDKFKSIDTNADGSLSLDEYKAGFPDPIPARKAGKGKGNAKGNGKGAKNPKEGKKAPAKPDTSKLEATFHTLDKDNDGKLSLEEYKAGFPDVASPEDKFKAMDTNGDGFLSLDEFVGPKPVKAGKKHKN